MKKIDLSKCSIEELEKALALKKQELNKPPTPLPIPNWASLQNYITSSINDAVVNQYEPTDFVHYVYEGAMEAVYGQDFWKWRNKQDW